MMRAGPRRVRKDANHRDIATFLTNVLGKDNVLDAASYGMPIDLIVYSPRFGLRMIEIKVPGEDFTKNEKRLIDAGWPIHVLYDLDDAQELAESGGTLVG